MKFSMNGRPPEFKNFTIVNYPTFRSPQQVVACLPRTGPREAWPLQTLDRVVPKTAHCSRPFFVRIQYNRASDTHRENLFLVETFFLEK